MSKKLTDEELIELARQATDEERVPLNEFETFMKDVGAGPGTDWVDAQHIYWKYLDWCLEKDIVPKSRYRFSHGIGKVYKRIFDKGTVYYVMNGEPFKLKNNEHWGMRRDWRQEREYRPWHNNYVKAGKASARQRRKNIRLEKKLAKEALKRKK